MNKKLVKKPLLRKYHTLDATNQSLGRLASRISKILQGKIYPSYDHSRDEGDFVTVKNINLLKFTGNKFEQKSLYWFSGYPGGAKQRSVKVLLAEKPQKLLKMTVFNMLPKNKLRVKMIKRLTVKN